MLAISLPSSKNMTFISRKLVALWIAKAIKQKKMIKTERMKDIVKIVIKKLNGAIGVEEIIEMDMIYRERKSKIMVKIVVTVVIGKTTDEVVTKETIDMTMTKRTIDTTAIVIVIGVRIGTEFGIVKVIRLIVNTRLREDMMTKIRM